MPFDSIGSNNIFNSSKMLSIKIMRSSGEADSTSLHKIAYARAAQKLVVLTLSSQIRIITRDFFTRSNFNVSFIWLNQNQSFRASLYVTCNVQIFSLPFSIVSVINAYKYCHKCCNKTVRNR